MPPPWYSCRLFLALAPSDSSMKSASGYPQATMRQRMQQEAHKEQLSVSLGGRRHCIASFVSRLMAHSHSEHAGRCKAIVQHKLVNWQRLEMVYWHWYLYITALLCQSTQTPQRSHTGAWLAGGEATACSPAEGQEAPQVHVDPIHRQGCSDHLQSHPAGTVSRHLLSLSLPSFVQSLAVWI